jgi:hypothetical protein
MTRTALILSLLLTSSSFAQSGNDELKAGGRVQADKPTVYLKYVCQDKGKVHVRMYNNTVWHVSVKTDVLYPPQTKIRLRNGVETFAAPNDREISLHYQIERWALPWEDVKVPKIAYPDNGFAEWIASRDSILFTVPVKYLRKDLQVIVVFNYEWEIAREGYTISDPEHRVSFRGIDFADMKPSACTD